MYLRDITPDYTYYGIASPWLQTKVLRALQYFPLPEGTGAQKQLHDVLQGIFSGELQQFKVLACLPASARRAFLRAFVVQMTDATTPAPTPPCLVTLCACRLW